MKCYGHKIKDLIFKANSCEGSINPCNELCDPMRPLIEIAEFKGERYYYYVNDFSTYKFFIHNKEGMAI